MDINYEKLENSRKSWKKLDNTLQNIFNEKSNVVYVFNNNEKEILRELKKYGLNKSNIVSIGYGGYLNIKDFQKFKNLNKYIKLTKKEFLKDKYNCCGFYLNSLWNYECRYSNDYSDAINLLKYYLNINSLSELDKELLKMLKLTEKYYNNEFDKIN